MDNEKFQELVMQQLAYLTESFKGLSQDVQDLSKGQKVLTEDVKEIRQSQARMEFELTEKIRALYDARQSQQDINERIINTLGRIEAKIDVLQMETASIRRIK